MADAPIYNPYYTSTSIVLGAGTSGVVDLKGHTLVGIQTPAALTGGTITYLAGTSSDGTTAVGNFFPVYDSAGNLLSTLVGTNQVVVDIPELAPLRYIQLVMGTQAAARAFTLVMK